MINKDKFKKRDNNRIKLKSIKENLVKFSNINKFAFLVCDISNKNLKLKIKKSVI